MGDKRMNIQSGRRGVPARGAQRRTSGGPSLARRLPILAKTVLFFAIAAGLFNSYIYLNQRISDSDRAIRKAKREITKVENEIAQARIRGEELRAWPYISSQIRRFNLQLRPAAPGQIRRMTMMSPPQAAQVRIDFNFTAPGNTLGSRQVR